MSIAINKDKCMSCSKCLQVCPGSLIKFDQEQKAYVKYPKDCWGCTSCIKECKQGAICLYLGADIGGRGSKMTSYVKKDVIHWKIEKSKGEVIVIDINRKDSNQY